MDLEDAPQEDPDAGLSVGTVHAAFILSAAVAVALTFGKDLIKGKLSTNSDVGGQTPQFKAFQRTYLTVYLLMMAGDWLQGPYMYALYDAYGFKHEEIAALFVAGFFCGAGVNTISTRTYLLLPGRVDGVHGGAASRQSSSSASTSSGARPPPTIACMEGGASRVIGGGVGPVGRTRGRLANGSSRARRRCTHRRAHMAMVMVASSCRRAAAEASACSSARAAGCDMRISRATRRYAVAPPHRCCVRT